MDHVCNEYAQLFTPCDKELGAGLIFNAGAGAANRQCDLHGGNRYTVSGEPDMDDALECSAKVGWSGAGIIGEALVAALSYNLNKPDGCNAYLWKPTEFGTASAVGSEGRSEVG